MTTVDYNARLAQAAQAYLESPAGSPQQSQALDTLNRVLREVSANQGAAKGIEDLSKIPAELAGMVARRIVDLSKAATDGNMTAVQGIVMADQKIIGRTLNGSIGMIDFAKSMVTLARMFAPEGSELSQWLDRFDEKLVDIRDGLRTEQASARTAPTEQEIARGTQLVQRAYDEATAAYNSGRAGLGQTDPGAGGGGASFSGAAAPQGRQPVSLASFVRAVQGDNTLEADEKRSLITTASAVAKLDANKNELSTGEVDRLVQTPVVKGLDAQERQSVGAHLRLELN